MADFEMDHSSKDSSADSGVSSSSSSSYGQCSGAEEDGSGQYDSKLLEFSEDEETLITRMYKLVGERWSLIAGRIPGRSAEEIKKFWTSRCLSSEE